LVLRTGDSNLVSSHFPVVQVDTSSSSSQQLFVGLVIFKSSRSLLSAVHLVNNSCWPSHLQVQSLSAISSSSSQQLFVGLVIFKSSRSAVSSSSGQQLLLAQSSSSPVHLANAVVGPSSSCLALYGLFFFNSHQSLVSFHHDRATQSTVTRG
jgi:ribosomal protein L19